MDTLSVLQRPFGKWIGVLPCALGLLVVLTAPLAAGPVEASCGGPPYAGPAGSKPSYLFSSSCRVTVGNQVRLVNEVCSITAGNLPFHWDKLNWVSGSQGVPAGQCLVFSEPTNKANVIDTPDSTIHLYGSTKGSDKTNVYLSSYVGDQESIEKSIERRALKDGGEVQPFHFKLSFTKRTRDKVSIRATIQGTDPVFYIYLPTNIKSESDLRAFIDPDYLAKISSYISFNDANDKVSSHVDDPTIADYLKQNELDGRARVSMYGDGNAGGIAFAANGNLNEIASSIIVCVGDSKSAMTCQ
jgi:hypothetical protein